MSSSLDRHHFHQTSSPSLESTNIWLGKQIGPTGLVGYTDHRTLRSKLTRGGPVKQYIHTMVFGHLALQIASIKRLVHSHSATGIKVEMATSPLALLSACIRSSLRRPLLSWTIPCNFVSGLFCFVYSSELNSVTLSY